MHIPYDDFDLVLLVLCRRAVFTPFSFFPLFFFFEKTEDGFEIIVI